MAHSSVFARLMVPILLLGTVLIGHYYQAVSPNVPGSSNANLQCGMLSTDCPEGDDPCGTFGDDTCYGNGCEEDDPFGTFGDDTCYGNGCEEDDPFGTFGDDTCFGSQCEDDRLWWQEDAECLGSLCDDDPWGGATDGCSSSVCLDGSFLVGCTYVTADVAGVAEGACDGPMGRARFDNCYPVAGAGTMPGTNFQTFRCSSEPGYQSGGYMLTDVAPSSDDDVVLVLCSPEVAGFIDPDTCENAPSGVKYSTCQEDRRVLPPIGSDGEWYICER